jgi:hypothetical protein
LAHKEWSFFPDQVAAASRSHPRRMGHTRRNVTALAYVIRLRYTAHAQGHLAVQDDVRRQSLVSVFRIESAGTILPHVDTRKTLPTQLLFEFFFLELRRVIFLLKYNNRI